MLIVKLNNITLKNKNYKSKGKNTYYLRFTVKLRNFYSNPSKVATHSQDLGKLRDFSS